MSGACHGRSPRAEGGDGRRVLRACFRPLAAALLLLGCFGGVAVAAECVPFLRMHGMLRRAQAECAFERFNPEIVDTARRCYERLGPVAGAPAMRAGAGE